MPLAPLPQVNEISIGEAQQWGVKYLGQNGFERPHIEVDVLLSGLLGCSKTQLHLRRSERLPFLMNRAFEIWVMRRAQHEPVDYILAESDFGGQKFYVDSRVLIPRPETEILTSWGTEEIKNCSESRPKVLELGVGSGVVSISMALNNPNLEVLASDVSREALEVAKINSTKLGVQDQIRFIHSDLFSNLGTGYEGYFDMIISNPPYVSERDWLKLDPDLFFEPKDALVSGPTGFEVIHSLIHESSKYLKAGGLLMLELGQGQAALAGSEFKKAGFSGVQIRKDDAGIERTIKGSWNG
jgi:release factor glutamine methyltransferase